MPEKYRGKQFSRFWIRLRYLAGAGVAGALIFLALSGLRETETASLTYRAFRGDLRVSILSGGNIQALRSQNIASRVQGQNMILEIVEEGTTITPEDVENGRVLVQLDSSRFEEQLEQERIKLQNAEASLVEARENYAIQVNRNESNINAAVLKHDFARMDLEKYLGREVNEELMADPGIDPATLVDHPQLAGEAARVKRQFTNAIDLAREELSRAREKLEWTARLEESGYATRGELEADRLAAQRREVEIEQARTAYHLFVEYDFRKQVVKYLSDYQEAGRELERVRANARAQLSQAESRLRNSESSLNVTGNTVARLERQIAFCTIRATQPGIVVYATGSSHPWWGASVIEPGVNVRMNQNIIQLPDFSEMVLELNISETSIDRIVLGQAARITIDAFPERRYSGEVSRIGVLPDSAMRALNPDINVYKVQVLLDGGDPDLRPGMSGQAEILVAEIQDVLMVPVSAVSARNGLFTVTRLERGQEETVEVSLGLSNESFVEVTEGLAEGDVVRLYARAGLPPEAVERPRHEEIDALRPERERPAAAPGGMAPGTGNGARGAGRGG